MCVLASFPASTAGHGLGMRSTQYVLGITFVTSYRPVASLVQREVWCLDTEAVHSQETVQSMEKVFGHCVQS